MRSRQSKPFIIHEILKGVSQEREEQYLAQVAAFSCQVSLNAIKKGIHSHIINNRKKPKTKYEYNQERVRDFRVAKSKPGEEVKPATMDEVADDLEQNGKASYALLQTDPVPFVRNYRHGVFNETIKMLNVHHPHFHSIEKLDLSNQMIGDERFVSLCEGIAKSSIRAMNISGNKLSNISMRLLSTVLRSMHLLEDVSISRNKVSDEGISYLFDADAYSATIRKFDCSYNICNAHAAYYLGAMFLNDRTVALDTLVLGGKVGRKGWGDEFVKVFVCSIIGSGLTKLKHVSIADAGLSELGLDCLTALLVCDEILLESLNISKNEFASTKSKVQFINALRLNSSLQQLSFQQCGFSETQSHHVSSIVLGNNRHSAMNLAVAAHSARHRQYLAGEYKLTWQERTTLAHCAAAAWSVCLHAHHKVKISFIRDNPWRIPGPLVWQMVKHATYGSSDLLSNIATLFQTTQVVLPAVIKSSLEDINRDMKYTDLLLEALTLSHTMAVDPRSVRVRCARKENDALIKATIEQIESDLEVNEARLESYTHMRKSAIDRVFKEIDQFRMDSEAVLRVAKRRERKNVHVIIAEVSLRMNTDRVLQCLEDARGAVMEEGQALEQLIAALYSQRLLHGLLSLESTTCSDTEFDFATLMRSSLPYYGNLRASATFVHYFYLHFGVERKENKKIRDKVLQNLQQKLNGSSSLAGGSSVASSGVPLQDSLEGSVEESQAGTAVDAPVKKKSKDRGSTLVKRKNVFMPMKMQSVVSQSGGEH